MKMNDAIREGISAREALFNVVGKEKIEPSDELVKSVERFVDVMRKHYDKKDYDEVPF